MKKIKLIGFLIVAAFMASAVRAEYSDSVRQALKEAVVDAGKSLKDSGLSGENISLLPFGNDDDQYVEGLLQNALTDAGFSCVEHRNDPMWEEILAEVEWDARKEDMLDPETLVAFGQLQGTQMMMYGNVREVSESASKVFVEIELHLTSLATKKHIWGGVFAKRFYTPGTVQGIIDLDPEARKLIKDAFAGAAESINQSSKLSGISSVAMVPLAGDIDGYVKSLTVDMLTETKLSPRELDVASLGEARTILRDGDKVVDAVLVGAVRDLSRELKHDEAMKDIYEMHAEVQLTLQSAETGEVLWSKTLSAERLDEERITNGEVAWSLFKSNPRIYFIAAGILIGLMALGLFLKSSLRPR